MLILQQMIVLFLMMMVGYTCFRKGLLNAEAGKKLSGIVVNVANPALILTSSIQEGSITGSNLVTAMIAVAVMYTSLLLIAMVIPRLLRVKREEAGVYRAMSIFSNIGFMGFPIIASIYGNGALLYGALFLIPYNILIYTYGIAVMKRADAPKENISVSKIFNIGVIASILAILIYMLRIPVPGFIGVTLTQLGNLAAPLSMIVIGGSLAVIDLKKLFTDVKLLCFSMIKLLLIPAAGVLFAGQFIRDEVLLGVCMVMLAAPVGSMTAMLAQQYDGDYELASKGVVLTTLLSVITLPIISALL